MCERCGAAHDTETCGLTLSFQGYAFAPPYLCMCCGERISPSRWTDHHACEGCEWGACAGPEKWPLHPLPSWLDTTDGTEAFELYAEYLEAIPRRGR